MGVYTQDAAGALADVTAAGGTGTWTRRTETVAESTGLSTETLVSIAGSVLELMSGQSDLFDTAKLTRDQGRLLMFTPSTAGSEIQVGDEIVWPSGGSTWIARAVKHLRPDGITILSYAVVSA